MHPIGQTHHTDCMIIGGGLVGACVGLGLAKAGIKVILFDEGDNDVRASRGNFGLIWVQGKGLKSIDYALWTQRAAQQWPDFAIQLYELSDVDVSYVNDGGILVAMSDQELQEYHDMLSSLDACLDDGFAFTMLDHAQTEKFLPGLGPTIPGGSFSPYDGHVNPLRLLHALHKAFINLGGDYRPNSHISDIAHNGDNFTIAHGDQTVEAPKIVFCAGLNNAHLGTRFGLATPVRPIHGQIMVSEPVAPCLKLPTNIIRQTDEGAIQIGYSQEDRGFDTGIDHATSARISDNALRVFPWLAGLRMVRQWAALRIMPKDGLPIYAQSPTHRGAFSIGCHSGVTLASLHASEVAQWVIDGAIPDNMRPLTLARFQ